MKILICEDDKITLKALKNKLKGDGYDIVTASNGKEAITILKDNDIDLLLTDLYMPFVDGLELISLVRDELKIGIPIIVLTRDSIGKTIQHAFELGANDYITKPFNPDELSLRVKCQLIRNK